MVDVTDRPDVDVRLVALELLLRHFVFAPVSTCMSACVRRTGEIYLTAGFVTAACRRGVVGSCGLARGLGRDRFARALLRRSSRRCSAGPPRSPRTASCRSPGPGCWSAGRSRSRTSRSAARGAVTASALPRRSWPSTRPRRRRESPITSPRNSSGVTTSTAKIGSSSTGLARLAASLIASEPATLKAISEESTSWYLPSTSVTRTSTIG